MSAMDLIYGKRTADGAQDSPNKKSKLGLEDLPTHLPNLPTQIFGRPKASPEEVTLTEVDTVTSATEAVTRNTPPIPGTNVVLETQADIDEWIRMRKENWMKRISNNREQANNDNSEPHGIHRQKPEDRRGAKQSQRDNNRQHLNNNSNKFNNGNRNQNQQRETRSRNTSQPKSRFNLNNAIIQRELSRENAEILDVIKELFDQGVITKPL